MDFFLIEKKFLLNIHVKRANTTANRYRYLCYETLRLPVFVFFFHVAFDSIFSIVL